MADLTAIPATITAGDSYAITLSLSDYPATAGWAVAFALAGAKTLTKTATASGADHVLAITTANTSGLTAGHYQWRLRATLGAVTETFQTGYLDVVSDLGAATDGSTVSWAETTLVVVEAALANTLTGEMSSYMIAGRRADMIPVADLLRIRNQLRAEVAASKGQPFGAAVRFDVVGMR